MAHVEAGLRSFNMAMPEEVNRILTDRISRWLFTPTATASDNLRREGVAPRQIIEVGDVMYDVLVRLNAMIAFGRRRFGMTCDWSLAGYAKRRVKKALQFIFDFEDSASHAARQRGLSGIICGHIHSAVIREVGGVTYVNCGDWVDSCTAIVEHLDGRLELIAWDSRTIGQVEVDVTEEEMACAS